MIISITTFMTTETPAMISDGHFLISNPYYVREPFMLALQRWSVHFRDSLMGGVDETTRTRATMK